MVFVGTFCAGPLNVKVHAGNLLIVREGTTKKFLKAVEHRTYSAEHARLRGQQALYVTERCVFQLTDGGLEVIEIASGIDLDRDVLAHMAFVPAVSPSLRHMDQRIFDLAPMGLREDLTRLPLAHRLVYDQEQDIFFVNLAGYTVRDTRDVQEIRSMLVGALQRIGHKVRAIVDYDNFTLSPDATDEYCSMVRNVAEQHYSTVTRYATTGFLRAKLGDALQSRGVAPHIFETPEEAKAHLRRLACMYPRQGD